MINYILDYISDNPYLYSDLNYTLTTNPYNIVYASKDGFIVEDLKVKTVYISFKNEKIAKEELKNKRFVEYLAYEDYVYKIMNDKPYFAFNIYYYQSRKKIDINKEFEFSLLRDKDLQYFLNHYDVYNEEELSEEIKGKRIYGLYVENRIIGFIGIHKEGSIGLLYIDENYRHQGYGYCLEASLINKLIDEDKPIWCEINTNNKNSILLNGKLGFSKISEKEIFWIRNDRD